MSSAEIEFLAEDDLVEIIPNFTQGKLHLICGETAPFKAGIPMKVPLWLAKYLKECKRCNIVAPDWITDTAAVRTLLEIEKSESDFTKMPSEHYMELVQIIIDCAKDEINNADGIRSLFKDIWDVRIAKLRTLADSAIQNEVSNLKLDNVTALELSSIRPLLPHSLDQLYRLRKATVTASADRTMSTQDSDI